VIRRWPKPTVVSFHGADVMPREDRPGYLERLQALLQEVPLVMVRSGSLRDRLVELGCPPGKLRMNRTGVPMSSFPVAPRDVPDGGAWRFVQACRLIDKKGVDVALRAFAEFRRGRPSATFTIAGEGPLREKLGRLAAELGVEAGVRFAGFLSPSQLNDLYARSHIFVHPSQVTGDGDQEGVPNSMLEAMATGLPVLATRHGGIPEAVSHGESGMLVAERDATGLASAMRECTSGDGARWRSMGAAAAAEVREKFEQAAQVAALEAVYREAFALGHPSAPRGEVAA
jgi:colanic acid/amylovoran biosynthesis glycosyltransferase